VSLLLCNRPLAQKQNVPVNLLGCFVAEVARVIFLFARAAKSSSFRAQIPLKQSLKADSSWQCYFVGELLLSLAETDSPTEFSHRVTSAHA
jgi:hypothetical protein